MKKLLPSQYGKVLFELTYGKSSAELAAAIEAFVQLLRKHQMMSKINYIVQEFTKHAKERDGIKSLSITTGRQLSDTEVKKIAKQFGEKVETDTRVDKNLLGGVIVRDRNTILDASIRTQLNNLKQQLL